MVTGISPSSLLTQAYARDQAGVSSPVDAATRIGRDDPARTKSADEKAAAKATVVAGRQGNSDGDKAEVKISSPGGESAIAAQLAAQEDTKPPEDDRPSEERPFDDQPTDEERKQLNDLAARDREVRAHEAAHAAAGGRYAGAPRYSYERGPNGKLYAVGGEVSIDASAVPGDPEATIQKLRTVKRAALAPAEPSSQDQQVARSADGGIRAARLEATRARAEEAKESKESKESAADEAGAVNGADNAATDGPADSGIVPRISPSASSAITPKVGSESESDIGSDTGRPPQSSDDRAPHSRPGETISLVV